MISLEHSMSPLAECWCSCSCPGRVRPCRGGSRCHRGHWTGLRSYGSVREHRFPILDPVQVHLDPFAWDQISSGGATASALPWCCLTGIAAVAGILFSWNIEHRAKEFFAFYLALIGGVYGVFLSFDLFLLFVFYELAIIPEVFPHRDLGFDQPEIRRDEAGALFVRRQRDGLDWDCRGLRGRRRAHDRPSRTGDISFPRSFQIWAFPLVFIGFAILAGIWPFHTWAPTGHVAAPTAASMLLAGVVMKLGAYGALRVAMTLFPLGTEGLAAMRSRCWRRSASSTARWWRSCRRISNLSSATRA